LIDEQFIEAWLRDIPDKIEQKLQDIVDAESVLKETIEKKINEQFKHKLLTRVLEDTSFWEDTEEMLSNIGYLSKFGVLIDYSLRFDDLYKGLDTLSRKINDIVDNFGIPEEEITQKVEKKVHAEAYRIIEEIEKECVEKKRGLIEEAKMYLSILKSLNEELPEIPSNISELEEKTLPELEEYARRMKKRSLDHLKESGMKLLNFLKGEAYFPKDIQIDDVKRALEVLRPVFLKGIREES